MYEIRRCEMDLKVMHFSHYRILQVPFRMSICAHWNEYLYKFYNLHYVVVKIICTERQIYLQCLCGHHVVVLQLSQQVSKKVKWTKENLLINSRNVFVLSSIHKQVKETIHRAFWNVLDADLKEEPPNYTQAMVLLGDVKEVIHSTVCLCKSDIHSFLAYVIFHYTIMVLLFYLCKLCYNIKICFQGLKCHRSLLLL